MPPPPFASAASQGSHAAALALIAEHKLRPDGTCLALALFDPLHFQRALTAEQQSALLRCLQSGIENPDCQIGCYAVHPQDYETFSPLFRRVLAEYHGVAMDARHGNDWRLERTLDLKTLGLLPLSIRVRVARNLSEFPLPAGMSRADRIALEARMCTAFE